MVNGVLPSMKTSHITVPKDHTSLSGLRDEPENSTSNASQGRNQSSRCGTYMSARAQGVTGGPVLLATPCTTMSVSAWSMSCDSKAWEKSPIFTRCRTVTKHDLEAEHEGRGAIDVRTSMSTCRAQRSGS